MNPGLNVPSLFTVSLCIIYYPSCGQHNHTAYRASLQSLPPPYKHWKGSNTRSIRHTTPKRHVKRKETEMSVLNVNMPERDLDPEEIDLEQEEEDAFGESESHLYQMMCARCRLTRRFLIQRFVHSDFDSYLDCKSSSSFLFPRSHSYT